MGRIEASAWFAQPIEVALTLSPNYPISLRCGASGSLILSIPEARALVESLVTIIDTAQNTDAGPAAQTADPAMTNPLVKEESS